MIYTLRMKLQDPDGIVFSDMELQTILDQYEGRGEYAQVDLAWADCLEIIVNDIQKWHSYSVGGLSETIDKSQMRTTIDRLRARWKIFHGGHFR